MRMPGKITKTCPDCGESYGQNSRTEAPHSDVCPAKTCQACWETYPAAIRPDSGGKRICAICRVKEIKTRF